MVQRGAQSRDLSCRCPILCIAEGGKSPVRFSPKLQLPKVGTGSGFIVSGLYRSMDLKFFRLNKYCLHWIASPRKARTVRGRTRRATNAGRTARAVAPGNAERLAAPPSQPEATENWVPSWCDDLTIGIFSGSGSCGKRSETPCTNIRRPPPRKPGKSFAAIPFANSGTLLRSRCRTEFTECCDGRKVRNDFAPSGARSASGLHGEWRAKAWSRSSRARRSLRTWKLPP